MQKRVVELVATIQNEEVTSKSLLHIGIKGNEEDTNQMTLALSKSHDSCFIESRGDIKRESHDVIVGFTR